jgi:hypothetical protein
MNRPVNAFIIPLVVATLSCAGDAATGSSK